MRSDLDVALDDGAGDEEYLAALERHLPPVLDAAQADLVFYLAGVDVAAGDRYGKLSLTEEGIRERERRVIEAVRRRGTPLVLLPAGGYAATRQRTAQLHAHVFRESIAHERAAAAARSGFPAADTRRPAATGGQSSETGYP
jgi:acetoin utilization deacetylase AcuC-like enzyme